MGRRFVIALIGACIAGSTLVGAGVAGAAKPPVVARGTLQCTVRGKLAYSAPLTPTARPTTATIIGKLSCTVGETGSALVVTSGKLTGTSTSVDMSCSMRNIAEVNAGVHWKASGGRVADTVVNLGAGADATGFRFTSAGIDNGSYAGQPLEINGAISSKACSTKGLKKSTFTGTVDLGGTCGQNILTANGIAPGDDYVWFVVAPFCDYLPADHPTGTMSVVQSGAPPACSFSGAIVDSGKDYALTPWGPPGQKPFTYWGIRSSLPKDQFMTVCNVPSTLSVTYSGDSRYRPFP
jgi:hypothetical protein